MKEPKDINVLIACEESQTVCKAFRELGFNAFSCDIQDCSGGHPEWHIKDDALTVMNKKGFCEGVYQEPYWDAMIAFPPCTHIAVSGAKHFVQKRLDGRQQESIDLFMQLVKAEIDNIAIENPIGIMSTIYRKPDQIIQPWQYGHGETKATCLWLKKLPKLQSTNIVEGREQRIWKMPPSAERAKLRSKTFPGIAQAMASQWGDYLLSVMNEPQK